MRRLETKLYVLKSLTAVAKIGLAVFILGYYLLIAALETNADMTIKTFVLLLGLLTVLMILCLLVLTVSAQAADRLTKRIARKQKYMKIAGLFNADRAEITDLFYQTEHSYENTRATGRILLRTELVHGTIQDTIMRFVKRNGIPFVVDNDGIVWYTENGENWSCIQSRSRNGKVLLLERN